MQSSSRSFGSAVWEPEEGEQTEALNRPPKLFPRSLLYGCFLGEGDKKEPIHPLFSILQFTTVITKHGTSGVAEVSTPTL